jgi:predicted Zn-dependent protease
MVLHVGPVHAPMAMLPLDEIQPAPELPPTPPVPTTKPSMESLMLFARGHDALLQNRSYTAIGLLERAALLDPYSYELNYELGRAYLTVGNSTDRAIEVLEKAAALRPDHLDVHLQLARLYLLRGDADNAIHHLRIGRLTDDYQQEEDSAAATDLLLARALQQKGYERAASDEYQLVLDDLEHPTMGMRTNMELSFLIAHPEVIHQQLGELAEAMGDDQTALSEYQQAATVDHDNFQAQAHVVRVLLKMGKAGDAAELAAKLVRQFQASPEAMDLLRQVYQQVGSRADVIAQLAKLHADQPEDRAILFTLADTMRSQGREAEAEKLLTEAAQRDGYEPDLVQRLFQMHVQRDDTDGAAVLLIEALAARPDSLRQLVPMWSQLLEPTRKSRLRLGVLQNLSVPPDAEAAKAFWISRVAEIWNRDELAKDSLAAAVKTDKPFGPAYRLLIDETWARKDWTDTQKKKFSEDLAQRAGDQGDAALAAELRGISLLAQKNPGDAEVALEKARQLGGKSPDLEISYAASLLAQKKNAQAEQALWKLVTDFPTCDDGYDALFQYYLNQGQDHLQQAMGVLRTWLADAPLSTNAKLLQATVLYQSQRYDMASQAFAELVQEHSDDAQVLNAAAAIYQQMQELPTYIQTLEKLRIANPQNQVVVEELVELYMQQHQLPEAQQVLDATHAVVGGDADLLYYLSHLYALIGQQQQAEDVLQEVLKIDPAHSGAANDLGYSWADEGRNLDQAEKLIRLAVKDEPDNESFLDSLGWVQYKRGEFSSALKSLQAAVADNPEPDPVVLNHLGDTYYRLGKKTDARKTWQEALARLGEVDEDREDLKDLRAHLPGKLSAFEHGSKIEVAPTAK